MPSAIRDEVPKLTFSFLVYSDRPEERMVTINGKRMREGEEVTSGLRLEEITPEGAILSWKGQRFHKSVF
jgi:general secretion pathway protein B